MIYHKVDSILEENKKKSNAELTDAVNDTNSALLTNWTGLLESQLALMELANKVALLEEDVVTLSENLENNAETNVENTEK